MKTTFALVCAIVSVLFAFLLQFWLRGRKGTGKDNARIFAVLSGRNSNFRNFQIVPVAAALVIVASAAGLGMGWKQAAACLAGAATALLPLFAGSFSLSDGVTSAYNEAVSGEVKQALVVYYLGEFENQLNQLAGRIFPGMSIRLVPEKGVTVSVDSKGTGEYMSISSLSGGEKACLTFLLMSLLSNITGCRVLILDELSVMDNTTLATFLDVLKENKAEYDLALLALVDHEDSKRILEEKGVPVLAV